MDNTLLKIRGLSVDYAVKEGMLSAVDDISLDIQKGEIFTLVGESGCGKSTLAFTIMRLLADDNAFISGSVTFDGRNLLALPEREMEKVRGREIGMIFQNPLDSLNPVYHTGDQVGEALALDGLSKENIRQRVLALYQEVKIPDAERRVRSFPHELSGGMRQRVMIAMMLARSPRLLIADEPTTALDVTIEAQILDILKGLRDQHNNTVLIITHNFGVVAEVADRVGVMYAGQLVELADVYSLFRSPRHPYTRALISALPNRSKHEGRIDTIPGSVSRILIKKPGCRFADRCSYAQPLCTEKTPVLRQCADGHFIKCHREAELCHKT